MFTRIRRRPATADLMAAFIADREVAGYSPHTIEGYRYALERLANEYGRLPLHSEQIKAYLLHWSNIETRGTKYNRLRAFYSWLVDQGHLEKSKNPMLHVPPPKVRRKFARSLMVDELRQLFAYPHKPHMRLFLLLLIDSGLRREEAFGITLRDVKSDTVVVTGKNGMREVPISREVRENLLQALPWPWKNVESAGQLVRRAFRLAGLDGKRASAHTLRVTWTRTAAMDKVNLKRAGGWANYDMLDHYLGEITQETIDQHHAGTPLRLLATLTP